MNLYLIYTWPQSCYGPFDLAVRLEELLAAGPICDVIQFLSLRHGEPTITQSLRATLPKDTYVETERRATSAERMALVMAARKMVRESGEHAT